MGNFSEFNEHFNILKNDENYIEYFNIFARSELRSNPVYMKDVMEHVLNIAEEKNFTAAKAWCLGWLGWYYHDASDFSKAIELHTESNKIFSEADNSKGIIFTCNALMSDYSVIGLYDMSIEYGLLGISIAEKEKDNEMLPVILVNTGVSYVELGYYNEAKELFEQLNLLPYKMNPITKGIWYQAMANTELHLGDLKQAYYYIEKGIEAAEEAEYSALMGDLLYVSAEVKAKEGRDREAVEDFKKSLEISLNCKDMELTSTVLLKWSKYQMSSKDYEGALSNLLKARDTAEQSGSKPLLKEIYKCLSDIYKLSGKFEEAFKFLELYSTCQKDMFNNISGISIAKMKNSEIKRQAAVYKSLYGQIALISAIGQKLTSNLNLTGILDTIYNEINGLVKADIFGISIYKENEGILDYKLFIENNKKIDMGSVLISDETSFGAYCFRNKADIIINDLNTEYIKYVPSFKVYGTPGIRTNSLIYCPIFIEGKVVGFINVQSYNKNMYSVNDLNILKALGSYVAIAIKNASLFDTIQSIANHDSLTGLLNRREIFNNGERAFYRFKRYSEDLCVAMIDIDNFKEINDIYGHNAGDIVIRNIAEIIAASVRASDFVGRYGGDEFLIVLPHTNLQNAYTVLERMRKLVEKHEIQCNDSIKVNVTISVGLFQINKETESFDDGVAASDKELYKSKKSGRNKVIYD